jgi:hypothetical protein
MASEASINLGIGGAALNSGMPWDFMIALTASNKGHQLNTMM